MTFSNFLSENTHVLVFKCVLTYFYMFWRWELMKNSKKFRKNFWKIFEKFFGKHKDFPIFSKCWNFGDQVEMAFWPDSDEKIEKKLKKFFKKFLKNFRKTEGFPENFKVFRLCWKSQGMVEMAFRVDSLNLNKIGILRNFRKIFGKQKDFPKISKYSDC